MSGTITAFFKKLDGPSNAHKKHLPRDGTQGETTNVAARAAQPLVESAQNAQKASAGWDMGAGALISFHILFDIVEVA